MPIFCGIDDKTRKHYYQWGENGKKYYYSLNSSSSRTRAYNKALKQGRAISISKKNK